MEKNAIAVMWYKGNKVINCDKASQEKSQNSEEKNLRIYILYMKMYNLIQCIQLSGAGGQMTPIQNHLGGDIGGDEGDK